MTAMTTAATVDRTHLLRALNQVKPAAASGRMGSVYGCARLTVADGQMRVAATDLEVAVAATIPADGNLDVAVPPKRLASMLRWADGPIRLGVHEQTLKLAWGRTDVELRTIPLDHLAKPVGNLPNRAKISPADLERIRRITASASRDDARPILTGISLDGTHAVATDSYRLAIVDLEEPLALDEPLLIPARSFHFVPKLLPTESATLEHSALTARLTVAETEITSVMITGEFPNWRGLVRKVSPTHVTFPRKELVAAMRVAGALIGTDGATPVRFEMDGNRAIVRTLVQDVGQSSTPIDITVEGHPLKLTAAFNARYMLDLLTGFEGTTVTFDLVDALKPLQVTEDRLTVLLMPVRVA